MTRFLFVIIVCVGVKLYGFMYQIRVLCAEFRYFCILI